MYYPAHLTVRNRQFITKRKNTCSTLASCGALVCALCHSKTQLSIPVKTAYWRVKFQTFFSPFWKYLQKN